MNVNHLRAFVAVVDTGSFGAAGRVLELSQPSITKAIQSLENLLGVSLLHRSRDGVTLTPYGKALLSRARLILNELNRAKEDMNQLTHHMGSRVSIAAAPSISELFMPRVIPRFRINHPNISINIRGGLPNTTLSYLADGAVDMVIGPRPTTSIATNIDSLFLFSSSVAITLRRDHPLAQSHSLADFADADWVLTSSAAHSCAPLAQAFKKMGCPPPNCRIVTDSFVAAQALTSRSNSVGLMPRQVITDGLLNKVLIPIDVPELFINNSVEIFFRGDVPLSPFAKELVNDFVAEAQRLC